MDVQEILLALSGLNDRSPDAARSAVRDLVARSTEAEQAAVITTLRRGATWDQARQWLERAQFDSASLPEGVYARALSLYGGSLLLAWQECLDVAPAMLYRPSFVRRATG